MTAALCSMMLGWYHVAGSWRVMFLIGVIPSLLSVFVFYLAQGAREVASRRRQAQGR